MSNAAAENRAVLAIALQRLGVVAIEEGSFTDAERLLSRSASFRDTAPTRTNLAIAHLRQNRLEEALAEALAAARLDPDHFGTRYMLGNIYYALENYEAALPELEFVFEKAPDFEIARALGFTYLSLKQPENARTLFEKTKALIGRKDPGLHALFAKFYERTNYPADAERELKEALSIDPRAPKVNLYLGYLLMQHGGSGRLSDALESLEKEVALDPDGFHANFFAGVAATTLSQHEKAIRFLEKAIKVNPESGESHLFLAQSQLALEDLESAEANLRKAVALERKGKRSTQARRSHFLLGRLLIRTGRKEEGLKELQIADRLQKEALDSSRSEVEKILGQVAEGTDLDSVDEQDVEEQVQPKRQMDPERVEQLNKLKSFLTEVVAQAYSNLGVIDTQYNRLGDAIANFSAASEWQPDFPNLARNLGIVRFRYAAYADAIKPLSIHLKASPDDTLARKLLGTSYYLTQDFRNAAETLKPLEAVLPSDPELAYFYGYSLVQLKRNLEAVPVFERMAAGSADAPDSLLFAAQGFMIAGDYERAIREFKRLLRSAPDTPRANYFIGQCLLRLNRVAEAESAFAKELEISPSDPVSKYHLALSLIEQRIDTDRAVKLLNEAIALRSGYADAHYQLGKIYIDRGETAEAIRELERAAAAGPDKDYVHYQLSIAYRKANRVEDAERELAIFEKLKDGKRNTGVPMPMGDN
ncbi:MAG TPA: tetratricopeptide repeat protein [Aridibacter sp.]|nr:tetratricopeptide repeat protein [Aridibacter sp.]